MKKKALLLLISTVVVVALVVIGVKVIRSSGSSIETEFIEFDIKDINKIDKIRITDNFGRVMEVVKNKKDNLWTDKDGNCIMQEGVFYLLDAAEKIEFKGYLNDRAAENAKNIMVTKHIKVDYYEDGEWSKTWYVGPAAQDHQGQIMLLDSKKLGKSSKPVVMQIKGVHGIIEPRFYADPLKWKCTQIIQLTPEEIKKVDVKFPLQPARSFSVEQHARGRFTVRQQNIPLPSVDTQFVFLYLNKFKKVHYETANYLLNDKQIDSLKRQTPFCVMKIDQSNGKSSTFKMYRINVEKSYVNEFGQTVQYDTDRFWCELPGGEIVKCQYFVFDPLTLGHMYFPLDLSTIDLNNYEVKDPSQYHDLRNR